MAHFQLIIYIATIKLTCCPSRTARYVCISIMELNSETLKIESKLINSEISWQQALVLLKPVTRSTKSWSTKEWKTERDDIIDDHCAQCGSSKPPMVLQHFSHPATFGKIFRSMCGPNAWPAFKKKYDYVLGRDLLVDRPTCPNCESTNIHELQMGKWSCYKCHTKHDVPIIKPSFTADSLKKMALRRKNPAREDGRWRAFQQYYGMLVGKLAVLEFINQSRFYLSFEDTATFCHSCAYAWDKKGIRLCQTCKEHWHPHYMPECKDCATKKIHE